MPRSLSLIHAGDCSHAFGTLHPLLARIEILCRHIHEATRRYGETADASDHSWNYLLGDRWTSRIEAALDKPDDLEDIRAEYDEAVVSYYYQSALRLQSHNRRIAMRNEMFELLREAIAIHSTLTKGSPFYRLKTLFEAAIVEGARAEQAEPKRKSYTNQYDRTINSRLYKIVVQVYRAFVAKELSQVDNAKNYPTGPAVPKREYNKKHVNSIFDFRRVHPVEFEDCVNDKHPHSARLATLLQEMDSALANATAIMEIVKAQRGEVNEQQHQGRLIDVLHGVTRSGTLSDPIAAVEAQNVRRVSFETARQTALINLLDLATLRDEVFNELKLATVEAEPLIELTMKDGEIVTVDKWRTAPIIMINCLAADLRLRKVNRALCTMQQDCNDDITGGTARRTIGEKFNQVSPRFRVQPSVAKPSAGSDGYRG